jgi:hypothetical protein
MKVNKWTLALATAGVVSLGSVVQGQQAQHSVLTALSSTTLSGYVDTSVHYNPGNRGGRNTPPIPFSEGKAHGFNLNVVQLTLEKPLDEGQFSAGYKTDLLFGPDAVGYNPSFFGNFGVGSDFGVKQAYVAFRVPVGNGFDFKLGAFDTIIGYEVFESPNNPNYTRSYGYGIAPTQHTGLLATYHISDLISVAGGIANTVNAGINRRAVDKADWYKSYMGAIAVTAPEATGFLAGSTFYGGAVHGYSQGHFGLSPFPLDGHDPAGFSPTGPLDSVLFTDWASGRRLNLYGGATMPTPVEGLSVGVAYDYLRMRIQNTVLAAGQVPTRGDAHAVAGYASFRATENIGLNLRGEYFSPRINIDGTDFRARIVAGTATLQYDLWAGLLSRLEFRWDRSVDGNRYFGGRDEALKRNAFLLAGNLAYKF